MSKIVSEDEAPALAPYGYKAGDTMIMDKPGLPYWQIPFEEYKTSLEPYTAEYVTKISKGNPDESNKD